MSITANTTLPSNIIAEQISEAEGKVHLSKRIGIIQLSTESETPKYFDYSKSGSVFFSEAIPAGYAVGTLTGGSTKQFVNFSSTPSTIAISSIYEHVRGYVNRDFSDNADANWNNYLSSTAGQAGLIRRKTDGSGLTGIRIIMFNRSDYGDRIKPGSFNATVNTSVSAYKYGISLDNSKNYPDLTEKSASDSGFWMGMTSNPGLVGSMQHGISGSILTGFSIYLRVRPQLSPCPIQTLFSRKSGDTSQTAMNNAIVDKQYMSLDPLSAHASVSSPYIWNDSSKSYDAIMNTAVNYRVFKVANTNNLFFYGNISVGDVYTLIGGDGTASVRITQVTSLGIFGKAFQFVINNSGSSNYSVGEYQTYAPPGRAAIKVQVVEVEAVPVPGQSTTAASSAIITIYNFKHGIMRWGISSNSDYSSVPLKFTISQAVSVTNNNFSTLTGWYGSSETAYDSSFSSTTSTVISYTNQGTAGDLIGSRVRVSGLTSGATSDFIFQKIVLSAGLSGIIFSFDMCATGNMYSGQALKTLVQRDTGPSADTVSICSFLDYYLIGYSQWPFKSTLTKNIDLLYDAPSYEFTSSAVWIGFTIDNSTATASDKEFHIQNVNIQCIPSTLYDGQSASVTAWFDSVPPTNSKNWLTLYARKKNLEIFPNKKIYFNLSQNYS
jgi:hypothetical protein